MGKTMVVCITLISLALGLCCSPVWADATQQEPGSDMQAEQEGPVVKEETSTEGVPDVFKVKFECSNGTFVAEFHKEWSPRGAERVYELVKEGFYDDARFFRVVKGFMAQVGMAGDPAVHSKWMNKNIQDDPVIKSNTRGMVTFAKTGLPNSRSTQLFINYGDNSGLDRQGFSPVGQVVEGMEVVDSLHSGYGDGPPRGRGPSQQLIQAQGNAYLNEKYPNLDYIKKATIID